MTVVTNMTTLNPIPAACNTAFKISFHPIYRISQFYQLTALILAVFPLTFIFYKIKCSRFHGNLKWLLCGYFGVILLFAIVFVVLTSAQVVIPFTTKDPCDTLLDPVKYQIGNFFGCFFMTVPTFFPMSITFERFWATREARVYEKTRVLWGPIITLLVILLDVIIMFFVYKDSNVTQSSYTFIIIPDSVAQRMYFFYMFMVGLNAVNFCLNVHLLIKNRRLTKINTTLTVRYQLEEVYTSTKFANKVIFIHVTFFGTYIAINISSRYWGSLLIPDPILLAAVRGAWGTMFATYNLFVGSAAVYFYSKIKQKTAATTNSMVRMQATGAAGASNYANAISAAWNTFAHGSGSKL